MIESIKSTIINILTYISDTFGVFAYLLLVPLLLWLYTKKLPVSKQLRFSKILVSVFLKGIFYVLITLILLSAFYVSVSQFNIDRSFSLLLIISLGSISLPCGLFIVEAMRRNQSIPVKWPLLWMMIFILELEATYCLEKQFSNNQYLLYIEVLCISGTLFINTTWLRHFKNIFRIKPKEYSLDECMDLLYDPFYQIISNYLIEESDRCIVIDGRWGMGKTHFIKVWLYMNSLENDLESIWKNINIRIEEEKQNADNENYFSFLNKYDWDYIRGLDKLYLTLNGVHNLSQLKQTLFKKLKWKNEQEWLLQASPLINHFMKLDLQTYVDKTTGETVIDFDDVSLMLRNYVLIFDDLERYRGDYPELFGFITVLCEEYSVKFIVLTNSQQLKGYPGFTADSSDNGQENKPDAANTDYVLNSKEEEQDLQEPSNDMIEDQTFDAIKEPLLDDSDNPNRIPSSLKDDEEYILKEMHFGRAGYMNDLTNTEGIEIETPYFYYKQFLEKSRVELIHIHPLDENTIKSLLYKDLQIYLKSYSKSNTLGPNIAELNNPEGYLFKALVYIATHQCHLLGIYNLRVVKDVFFRLFSIMDNDYQEQYRQSSYINNPYILLFTWNCLLIAKVQLITGKYSPVNFVSGNADDEFYQENPEDDDETLLSQTVLSTPDTELCIKKVRSALNGSFISIHNIMFFANDNFIHDLNNYCSKTNNRNLRPVDCKFLISSLQEFDQKLIDNLLAAGGFDEYHAYPALVKRISFITSLLYLNQKMSVAKHNTQTYCNLIKIIDTFIHKYYSTTQSIISKKNKLYIFDHYTQLENRLLLSILKYFKVPEYNSIKKPSLDNFIISMIDSFDADYDSIAMLGFAFEYINNHPKSCNDSSSISIKETFNISTLVKYQNKLPSLLLKCDTHEKNISDLLFQDNVYDYVRIFWLGWLSLCLNSLLESKTRTQSDIEALAATVNKLRQALRLFRASYAGTLGDQALRSLSEGLENLSERIDELKAHPRDVEHLEPNSLN